ncbi:MAG: tautomerase family protein [Clostridia bacterium]|nr:tautomerase family protein [Clostridia bacterium]
MPHIHIDSIPGRDEANKKKIAEALLNALVEAAPVPKEYCYVTFGEVKREDWLEYDKNVISAKPEELYFYKGEAKK